MLNICARLLLVAFTASVTITSCVPKKKFVASQASLAKVRADSTSLAEKVASLQADVNTLTEWNNSVQQQYNKVKAQLETTTRDAAGKIATQQSLLNQSKEELAEQQRRLETLQGLLEQQKKNADALRLKISEALVKFNSNELTVTMKNGKVYVSLQE